MNLLPKQLPEFKIKEILSSPPRRYWNKFLFLLVLIALAIFFFDGWVFRAFSPGGAGEDFPVGAAVETLNKEAMRRVFEDMDQKAANFERAFQAAGVEDPS